MDEKSLQILQPSPTSFSRAPSLPHFFYPFARKQLTVLFKWCVRLPFRCSVHHLREILKQAHFMPPASKCHRVEYGTPLAPLTAIEKPSTSPFFLHPDEGTKERRLSPRGEDSCVYDLEKSSEAGSPIRNQPRS